MLDARLLEIFIILIPLAIALWIVARTNLHKVIKAQTVQFVWIFEWFMLYKMFVLPLFTEANTMLMFFIGAVLLFVVFMTSDKLRKYMLEKL